ncbi:MAG: thioesterase [Firmicutes bacterium]|nr:thioesterase [Bacillota bacterium]
MQPIFRRSYEIRDHEVDRFGRLKPSAILYFAQDAAGFHCDQLALGHDILAGRGLFWAVTRHKVQITRLPMRGETITLETWPLPTTRVAYPRSTVAYDADGHELFRSISLWVLMDINTRALVLPGKSGVEVTGLLRGSELAVPNSLTPRTLSNERVCTVAFTELDRNGHMNNCSYMDWISNLLPSEFHSSHPVKEFTVCYLSEAREGQTIQLHWELSADGVLRVDGGREEPAGQNGHMRVFSAQLLL